MWKGSVQESAISIDANLRRLLKSHLKSSHIESRVVLTGICKVVHRPRFRASLLGFISPRADLLRDFNASEERTEARNLQRFGLCSLSPSDLTGIVVLEGSLEAILEKGEASLVVRRSTKPLLRVSAPWSNRRCRLVLDSRSFLEHFLPFQWILQAERESCVF